MRGSLAVFAVMFMTLLCIGIAAADPGGTVLPAQNNATDVRVIIILDTPPTPVSAGPESAEPVPAHARSLAVENLQDPVVSELARMDAREIRDLPMFNAVSCQVSPSELETLKDMPGVARVVPDRIIQLLEDSAGNQQGPGSAPGPASTPFDGGGGSGTAWGITRIGAPSVWDYSINGTGINVSVIDTGINANHPDLTGRVVAWKDLVSNLESPYDDHGHGTHVAGTIAGTGAGGTKTGVAPGANLIVVKVFDSTGNAYTSTVMAGFQWAVDHGADIISFSGGSVSLETGEPVGDFSLEAGMNRTHPVNVSALYSGEPSFRPAWIAVKLSSAEKDELNVTLHRPDGTVMPGEPMTWMSPQDSDFFFKYTNESGPLPQGTWQLELTRSGTGGNHLWYSGTGLGDTTLTNTDIDLSNTPTASLRLTTRYNLNGPANYATVKVSPVEAESWQSLATFSGKNGTHTEQYDLSDFTGQHIRVRFILHIGNTQSSGGWYIDNPEIPEIGYLDTVENGTGNWTGAYWSIVQDQSQYHISSVNIMYPDDGTSNESLLADTIAAQGVLPVIAAGNEGTWRGRTIDAPGTSLSAMTAGATEEIGDVIAGLSGRGPVGYGANTRIKPDIVAPGIAVKSTSRYGGYEDRSGTSMATPHVAGTAALMLQANRSLTPVDLKRIIMQTAVDRGDAGIDPVYGAGRINASAAVFNVTGWDMMRGDFNNNGRTDIGDVVSVSYMAAGLSAHNGAADYNHNLRVDAGDAAKIAWYYVGKTPELYPAL